METVILVAYFICIVYFAIYWIIVEKKFGPLDSFSRTWYKWKDFLVITPEHPKGKPLGESRQFVIFTWTLGFAIAFIFTQIPGLKVGTILMFILAAFSVCGTSIAANYKSVREKTHLLHYGFSGLAIGASLIGLWIMGFGYLAIGYIISLALMMIFKVKNTIKKTEAVAFYTIMFGIGVLIERAYDFF